MICIDVTVTISPILRHTFIELIFQYAALAVRWPTRALQQEEEEEAMATALQHLQLPTIEVRCALHVQGLGNAVTA